MKTAYIFPGQGSQKVGMGKELAQTEPAARAIFEEADAVLGMGLSSLCFEGPEQELALTAVTQPAVLTASIAALRVLEQRVGRPPDYVAGHSLGEYSALVCAGALSFGDAVKLVRERGQFMQEAVPAGEGLMAAIIGCEDVVVAAACAEASQLGVCSVANINSSGQTVIAGHRQAVEHAVELLKERGARRTAILAVSAPFHCELMKPAAERLRPLLEKAAFNNLAVPLVTNVDAETIWSSTEARSALDRQVAAPVRWYESVVRMINDGVSRFVEIGPGKVLSGLVRQMSREVEVLSIQTPDSLEAAVAVLA